VAVQGRSGRQVASQLGISEGTARQLVFRARASLRAAAAACLAPPLMVLRWLRRLAAAPARALTALRDGPLDMQQATEAAKCVKFGALAVVGAAAVGAGAFQLAAGPHHPATSHRGTGHGRASAACPVASLGAHATGAGNCPGREGRRGANGWHATASPRRHTVTQRRRYAGGGFALRGTLAHAAGAGCDRRVVRCAACLGRWRRREARAATGSPFGAVSAAAITRAGVPGRHA